ncbi:hypothetical protein Unana1_02417 [Umbelopsis nana]
MPDNDQHDDMEAAIQQSLQQLQEDMTQHEREKEELRQAIALSLDKPVEKLTARDTLSALPILEAGTKRLSDSQTAALLRSKKIKTEPETMRIYFDGVVKLTHVHGFSGPDYISIESVLETKYLKKALLTAFVVSMDYVEQQFPNHINAKTYQIAPKRIIVHPPMKDPKFGVFHSKLMLLFHQSSLRVVIGSANFVDYDWCELENVLFIQDFPLLKDGPAANEDTLPDFGKDIYEQLSLMGVPMAVKKEILLYDFSKAKAHIVASVSGTHEGDAHKKFGHTRISAVVRHMGLQRPNVEDGPTVELQTSSLGAMTLSYLQELYLSFCGINTYNPQGSRAQKEYKKSGAMPPTTIIYPTTYTIDHSNLGRQYIIATFDKPSDHTTGWVYIGSHNSTTAAWGKTTLSRDTKEPKISMSNWELGVVLPISANGRDEKHICDGIPVPFVRPAEKYLPNQEPWTQDLWS